MEGPLVFLLVLVAVAAVCCFIGAYVAKEKGRSGSEGFLFAFFLGPIGILIVALLPNKPSRKRSTTYRRTSIDEWPLGDEAEGSVILDSPPLQIRPEDAAFLDRIAKGLDKEAEKKGRPGRTLRRPPGAP